MEDQEREKKQYDRQNKWIAENRERITVTFPKGTKDRIKKTGCESLNSYILELVLSDLDFKNL